MSQASSEFDDLDESGELDSAVFGASELSGDDFGSEVGFEEAPSDDLSDDLMTADVGMQSDGFDDAGVAAAVAPAPFMYKKQGFSIYTLMLILSFIALTATAIIMFTYASSL